MRQCIVILAQSSYDQAATTSDCLDDNKISLHFMKTHLGDPRFPTSRPLCGDENFHFVQLMTAMPQWAKWWRFHEKQSSQMNFLLMRWISMENACLFPKRVPLRQEFPSRVLFFIGSYCTLVSPDAISSTIASCWNLSSTSCLATPWGAWGFPGPSILPETTEPATIKNDSSTLFPATKKRSVKVFKGFSGLENNAEACIYHMRFET